MWDNRAAQMALLAYAANAPRTMVDFGPLVAPDQVLSDDVRRPDNSSWMCVPLYAALIGLAASGLSMEVTEALAGAAGAYPEYVAVGLAQVAVLDVVRPKGQGGAGVEGRIREGPWPAPAGSCGSARAR